MRNICRQASLSVCAIKTRGKISNMADEYLGLTTLFATHGGPANIRHVIERTAFAPSEEADGVCAHAEMPHS